MQDVMCPQHYMHVSAQYVKGCMDQGSRAQCRHRITRLEYVSRQSTYTNAATEGEATSATDEALSIP